MDELWLAQESVDLAARTEPLRGTAYRFAAALTEAARTGTGFPPQTKAQFMDASYGELWPGQPRSA